MSDEVLPAPVRHRPAASARNAQCTRPTGASTALSWTASGERDLPEGDGWRGRGWSAPTVRVDGVEELTGWWACHGRFMLTVVTAVPTPTPIGSDEAGALEAAAPDRLWPASPLNAPPARGPSRAPVRR
jgi:hypothetical protein